MANLTIVFVALLLVLVPCAAYLFCSFIEELGK